MNRLLLYILFAITAIPAAAIEAADGQQWYGYYSGSEQLAEFGTGQPEHYMCAIYLPGNQGQAYGKTIRALRFVVQGVADLSDVDVWLSTTLPGTMDDVDIEQHRVNMSAVSDLTPFDVALDAPYAVPDGSYLYLAGGAEELRGEAWLLSDGAMQKCSAVGETLRL